MLKLLSACIAASLATVGAHAQDKAAAPIHSDSAPSASAVTSTAALPVASKSGEKKAEKKAKPKPTKRSKKPAPRPGAVVSAGA